MQYQSHKQHSEFPGAYQPRSERNSVAFLVIEEVAAKTGLPVEAINDLVEDGLLTPFSSKSTGKMYFSENSVLNLPLKIDGEYSVHNSNSSDLSISPTQATRFVPIEVTQSRPLEVKPEVGFISPPSKVKSYEVVREFSDKPNMKKSLAISVQDIATKTPKEIKALDPKGRRSFSIESNGKRYKSIKLEVNSASCIISGRKGGTRIELKSWQSESLPSVSDIEKAISNFHAIRDEISELNKSEINRLLLNKPETIADLLDIYIQNHINNDKGSDSDTANRLESLIRLHLSNLYPVATSGKIREICLLNMPLSMMTKAIFRGYLKNFRHVHGTHDRIVTYIKAATNFCLENRLLSHLESANFHEVKKLNVQRHVIIDEKDLKKILEEISLHHCEQFMMFMTLQMTGQCRTSEVVRLRIKDIDFSIKKIKLTVKGGRQVWAPFHDELFPILIGYIAKLENKAPNAYLFPSKRSESGHRTNFAKPWDELRMKLNFYTLTPEGEIKYQIRLHDFRETMVDRLAELDSETVSDLLNHTSNYSIKSYRKANPVRTKKAAILNGQLLHKMIE
ncbi:tyrosine-type recombinase/integrase [Alteromonas lipolytica]|uniref:Tyr recombinase domain-containing protein n=1 Tax=Alteromonas lipolytica TaxID=1856405 RepID=A0A1E8FDA6_9ALTE|nr:tyrosine-type recombinase/integrase [Alteromonas lipolytica]OFI33914.1 hypothetical protein BFC17_20330 [Alteromonas lipolytica]GGF67327.1 hypothetical protein GCM10011338_19330 [Alteromonas lipolytica]